MLDDSMTFDQLCPAEIQGGRPALLAIAGDSATGKTTLSHGLVQALGPENCLEICVDDYHRYDRNERKDKPFTPLHPKCNYMGVMEQHLVLISRGQQVLKPIYNHDNGMLERPELVEPRPFGVIEGLLPLHTEGSRACFDVTVFLDPPESLRIRWKMKRDTGKRGYNEDEVKAELEKREPEAAEFIRPQRSRADMVVRFAPEDKDDDDSPLGATIYLAPTIPHPPLAKVIDEEDGPVRLELCRDEDGRPVEALHIRPDVREETVTEVAKMCWAELGHDAPDHKALPTELGALENGDDRSLPLALTQLVLLYHLVRARTH